jgi:hypothetical protein
MWRSADDIVPQLLPEHEEVVVVAKPFEVRDDQQSAEVDVRNHLRDRPATIRVCLVEMGIIDCAKRSLEGFEDGGCGISQ